MITHGPNTYANVDALTVRIADAYDAIIAWFDRHADACNLALVAINLLVWTLAVYLALHHHGGK